MSIIDISWPINESMTAYKDKSIVAVTQTKQFERDHVREALVTLGTHSGTHIDAPSHFIEHGQTMDQLDFSALVGRCRVLDCTHIKNSITVEDLEPMRIEAGDRILLKTSNSNQLPTASFNYDFVYLSADGAQYLAQKKISTVGIDYLGIERQQPDHATHKNLFEASIVIIEGLRLAHVKPGVYDLYCLPLYLKGLEASPARAILISQ